MSSVGKDTKRRRIGKGDSPAPELRFERDRIGQKERKNMELQQKARAVYQAEDDLVSRREAGEDVSLFHSACQKISVIMAEIHQLKIKQRPESEIVNKRIECCIHFLTLRKLNRLAHLRCKKVRENTIDAKQKADQYHLQLLNLAYEVSHQEKEITKCLQFKSKHEEIKLVDEEEFYKEAPPEICKPSVTRSDDHQKTLSRLHWELEQRKRLTEKLEETDSLRELVTKAIEIKREHLHQLGPKLAAVLESTKPVQEYLKMPFDEVKEQHRLASFLPDPLYVLYMQATGYREACDKEAGIMIEGDTEEAARLHELSHPPQDEVSEEEEQEEELEGGKKRKKHRRHVSQAEQLAAKKRELLKSHPLSIRIVLKCANNLRLQLVFSYLSKLRIVTVTPELEGVTDCQEDLLQAGILLQSLYPGDNGYSSPNPANHFQLKKRGLDFRRDCQGLTGTPYHWVQWLAGLQFLSQTEPGAPGGSRTGSDLSGSVMDEVMRKLRKRVGYRLLLQQQISAISKGVVCVPEEFQGKFPVKINSKISSWERVCFADYQSLKHCEMFVNEDLVHDTDMIYKAQIQNGSACLTAHVAMSPDYPAQRPLFSLLLYWHTERTRETDPNIRLMESEVNYHCEDWSRPHGHLLTNQIQRLLMCLDVYLEAACASQSETPVEFPREKIMPRMTRGPQREMPFRYLDHVNIFTQR